MRRTGFGFLAVAGLLLVAGRGVAGPGLDEKDPRRRTLDDTFADTSDEYAGTLRSATGAAKKGLKARDRAISRELPKIPLAEREQYVVEWRIELVDECRDFGDTSYEEFLYVREQRRWERAEELGEEYEQDYAPGVGDAWDEAEADDEAERARAWAKFVKYLGRTQGKAAGEKELVTFLHPPLRLGRASPDGEVSPNVQVGSLAGFGDGTVRVELVLEPRSEPTLIVVEGIDATGGKVSGGVEIPAEATSASVDLEGVEPGRHSIDVLHDRDEAGMERRDTVEFTVPSNESPYDPEGNPLFSRRDLVQLRRDFAKDVGRFGRENRKEAKELAQALDIAEGRFVDGKTDEDEMYRQFGDLLEGMSEAFSERFEELIQERYRTLRERLSGKVDPESLDAIFGPGTREWNETQGRTGKNAESIRRKKRKALERTRKALERAGRSMSFVVEPFSVDEAFAVEFPGRGAPPGGRFEHIVGFDNGTVDAGCAVNPFVGGAEDGYFLKGSAGSSGSWTWPLTLTEGGTVARARVEVPESGPWEFEIVWDDDPLDSDNATIRLDRMDFTVPPRHEEDEPDGLPDDGSPGVVLRVDGGPVVSYGVVMQATLTLNEVSNEISDFTAYFRPTEGDGTVLVAVFDHAEGIPIPADGRIVIEPGGVGRGDFVYDPIGGGIEDTLTFDWGPPYEITVTLPSNVASLGTGEMSFEFEVESNGSFADSWSAFSPFELRARVDRVTVQHTGR